MDRFSHKVIIISRNLDGFSLANHGRFAKLLPRQTSPLYDIYRKASIYIATYIYICIRIYPIVVNIAACMHIHN